MQKSKKGKEKKSVRSDKQATNHKPGTGAQAGKALTISSANEERVRALLQDVASEQQQLSLIHI